MEVEGYNRVLMLRKVRRALALVLFSLSIWMIVWAALPNRHMTVEQNITPDRMTLPAGVEGERPASIPARQLRLEWPSSMRIGEEEQIRLSFTQKEDQPGPGGQTKYQDAYAAYNLMADSRYEVAGMRVEPAAQTRESMPAGKPVELIWKISSNNVSTYDGQVWLSLRYLPLDGSPAVEVPIYAREVSIRTSSLFGMNESVATLLGGIGILASVALVYDDFARLIPWMVRKKAAEGKP